MSIQLTQQQVEALPSGLPVPVATSDGRTFYLLSADQYSKVRALLDDDFDVRAMYPHMTKVFGDSGWDDPEMDVYDSLDPRRSS